MCRATHSRMLISRSLSHFSFSANTPSGGSSTARMILQISPAARALRFGCHSQGSDLGGQQELPAAFGRAASTRVTVRRQGTLQANTNLP